MQSTPNIVGKDAGIGGTLDGRPAAPVHDAMEGADKSRY
jgi:hypothetical protein